MFFSFSIVGSFLIASVNALTFDPDYFTTILYDIISLRYYTTTMSFEGNTLKYIIRSMASDLEILQTAKDFSDFSNAYISYNSKYRTFIEAAYSSFGYYDYDAVEDAKSLINRLAPYSTYWNNPFVTYDIQKEESLETISFSSHLQTAPKTTSSFSSDTDTASISNLGGVGVASGILDSSYVVEATSGISFSELSHSPFESNPIKPAVTSFDVACGLSSPYLALAMVFGGLSLLMF